MPGLDCCWSPDAHSTTTRLLVRPELEVPGLLGGRLLTRVAADYTLHRQEFDDPEGPIGLTGRKTDDIDSNRSHGAEAAFVLAVPRRQAISFLASERWETAILEDRRLPGPTDLGTASRRTTVATLEDQIALGTDRLILNPSVRYEAYDSLFRPGAAGGLVVDLRGGRNTTGKIGFRLTPDGDDMRKFSDLAIPASLKVKDKDGKEVGALKLALDHANGSWSKTTASSARTGWTGGSPGGAPTVHYAQISPTPRTAHRSASPL